MAQALCVPVYCDCGERMLWQADVRWLEREGVKVAGPGPLTPHRQPPPRGAQDVTGVFSARCSRCFNILPVFPMIRTRLAAGAGVLLDPPQNRDGTPPAREQAQAPRAVDRGARLANRDGRRARRTRPDTSLSGLAFAGFHLSIVDLSSLGLCAEHTHQTQAGHVYTLDLNLPSAGTVRITARVAWTTAWRIDRSFGTGSSTYRSGFEFVDVDPKAAAAIEGYVVRAAGRAQRPAARAR